MSAPPPALPALAVAAAATLLTVAAWERAALRRRERAGEKGDPLRPALATLQASLEVRLSAWIFFGGVLWLHATRLGSTGVEGRAGELWLFAAAVPAAGLCLLAGRGLGGRRPFPGALRWLLAPVHGLTAWVLWLRGLVDRGARAAEAPATAAAGAAAEASPAEGVRDLAELSLAEVMVPRSQVVALDGRRTLREILPVVRRRPHSIYPVYDGEIDQPLGMVRILQLTAPEALDRPLRELVHPAAILPETVKALRLLHDLSRAEIPAALVVDEFGSLAGFVTIEDLMEVAIGELEGEHEVVRSRVLADGDGAWRIDGGCTIEEFSRHFGPLIPEGEYETVAGYFLDRLGEIPEVGTEVELAGLRLEVLQRTERRILWVRAEPVEAAIASD